MVQYLRLCDASRGHIRQRRGYSIEGPGAFTFDAMLTRAFPIREHQNLEVRFEAFNFLNHPVFNNPGTTLTTSSSFGKILSANDPRILQFAMKYVF